MFEIIFEYRDEMSGWKWRQQSCRMSSVEECKKIYSMGNAIHNASSGWIIVFRSSHI